MDERDLYLVEVCEHGKVKQVEKLLNQGADPNARVGESTPLLSAAERGDPAIISVLIQRGADVNLAAANNSNKRALHVCCSKGHLEAAIILLKNGASTEYADSWGRFPLHHATSARHASSGVELVKLLFENGSKGFFLDREGNSPLHAAALSGSVKILQVLLTRFDVKVNIDAQNQAGKTALHIAGEHRDPLVAGECSQLLLSHGAVATIANSRGELPNTPKDVNVRNHVVLRSPGLGGSASAAAAAAALKSPRVEVSGVFSVPAMNRGASANFTANGKHGLASTPSRNDAGLDSSTGAAAFGGEGTSFTRGKTMPPIASRRRRSKPPQLNVNQVNPQQGSNGAQRSPIRTSPKPNAPSPLFRRASTSKPTA